MPDIDVIRREIERMRNRVNRQRAEITQLRHAGISTTSAGNCSSGCSTRSTTSAPQAEEGAAGQSIGSSTLVKWFDDERDPSPFLRALEEVRRMATREGWRYQHVQAIIVAIDQYAEAATGNRDFFLNRPPGASRADMP